MSIKVVQSSLVRQVKSLGASVGNHQLQNQVIKWIESCSSSSASPSTSIENFNVVLFDSHTDSIARRLLERKVKSVHLLEGSQMNADKQKEAVEKLEDEYPNQHISALHASMPNILSPSKSVHVNGPFWKRLLEPIEPPKEYKNYPKPQINNKIIMFGCLPFPTQQRALLSSLLEQLLIYYDVTSVLQPPPSKKSPLPPARSYFQFGSFSLITFLHPSHFVRIISAPLDSPELLFFGKTHRMFSHIFHTLFNVVQLSDSIEGYDLSQFHPQIPLTPMTSYQKPIHKLGYDECKLYPIKIEPKQDVILPGGDDYSIPFQLSKNFKDLDPDVLKRRKLIVDYAFWLMMTSKTPKQQKITWELFGLSNDEIPASKTASDYARIFPQICDVLPEVYENELKSFRINLYKNKSDEKVID